MLYRIVAIVETTSRVFRCTTLLQKDQNGFGLCIYIARISTQKGSFLSVLHTLHLTVFRELHVHIPGQQRKILPGSVPTIWKTAPTDEGISARSRRKVSGLSAIILNSIINNYNFRGHCDLFWG